MATLDGGDGSAAPVVEAPGQEPDQLEEITEQEEGQEPSPQQDDLDEIQFDQDKYRVPKPLKEKIEAWRAGTSRRDQEIAAERKALAEARERVESRDKEIVQKHGQLAHADEMLSRYQQLDWNALRAQDPETAQARLIEWQQWRDHREALSSDITQTEARIQEEARRATESRLQEAEAILKRKVKNWDEIKGKVGEFAIRELGYSAQQLSRSTDPQLAEALYLAWQGTQLLKQQAAAAKKAPAEVEEEPKPAPRPARGSAPATTGPSDRDPTETWMEKRNRQLAAKRSHRAA